MTTIPTAYLWPNESYRYLDTLTGEQIDDLEEILPRYEFSSRARGARLWLEAVRRGWLLGPA